MDFLEKDLEDIIFETDSSILDMAGLEVFDNKLRQVIIGNYGVCDLISWYKIDSNTIHIQVFELKKGEININTYLQVIRYAKGLISYLKQRNVSFTYYISIILIGRTIDLSNSFVYIPEFNRNVQFYTYEYKINGLYFKKSSNYTLTNEGFKIKNKKNGKKIY